MATAPSHANVTCRMKSPAFIKNRSIPTSKAVRGVCGDPAPETIDADLLVESLRLHPHRAASQPQQLAETDDWPRRSHRMNRICRIRRHEG